MVAIEPRSGSVLPEEGTMPADFTFLQSFFGGFLFAVVVALRA